MTPVDAARLDNLRTQLAEAPLLAGLDPGQIAKLVPLAAIEVFEAGRYLLRDGSEASRFFLIRHGTVAVELEAPPKGRLVLQTLHEGEALGWSWLVPPYRWAFDARAVSLTRTLSLDTRRLQALFEADHELGYQLLQRFVRVMAGRLTAARLQMLDLYAADPPSNV